MSNHTGKLQGKIAIVTGGGSGFGAGIVRKFITEGVKVLILDINQADAERVGAEAPKGAASAIKGNVSSEHDWQMALTLVLKEFGGLDVVVNNAGVLHTAGPSIDLDEKEYDRVMRINVKQLFWSTKVIIPYFTSSNRPGLFINTSSISGARPRPNLVWYAASKGAVNSVCFITAHSSRLSSVRNKPLTSINRLRKGWQSSGRNTTYDLMPFALLWEIPLCKLKICPVANPRRISC